jgi:hypothetical protein
MKKNSKKQKRKEQIISLATDAKTKINQNKILSEQIDNYNKHLQMIKSFMNKYSQKNVISENKPDENENIKNEFKNYYQQLKKYVEELKEATKKIKQKYETNSDIYFDDVSGDKLNYKQIQVDFFILSYSLEQKLNIIKKLKESIHYSKDYNIFREPKRETLVNPRYCEDNIDDLNIELQKYALYEFKQFNKYHNRCQKKIKKINNIKNKINIFKQIIKYFEQVNHGKTNSNNKQKDQTQMIKNSDKNKNNNNKFTNAIIKNKKIINKKNYKDEEENNNYYNTINPYNYRGLNNDDFGKNLEDLNDYETDQTFNLGKNINNLFSLTSNINNNKAQLDVKKNKKINLPTVEELFDLTNNEGEKEAIIDDELHSDDEIVFEKKIKSKKKIIDDKPSIKKVIPNLYLSQIEFNKSKVMNEADLYSYQRRKFQRQNMDENIKMMKKN